MVLTQHQLTPLSERNTLDFCGTDQLENSAQLLFVATRFFTERNKIVSVNAFSVITRNIFSSESLDLLHASY